MRKKRNITYGEKEITSFRAVRSPMNLLFVQNLSELWSFSSTVTDQHTCGKKAF